MEKIYIVPNATGPTQAVSIDTEKCIGCYSCANVCRTQTIMPNPVKGQPPVVVYPDECWYCACCVEFCPTGALSMNLPINQRILFKRRETGEVFRIGQKNPPPKSYFRPPAGWMGPGGAHEEGSYGEVWKLLLARERKQILILLSPDTVPQIVKALRYKDSEEDSGKVAGMLRNIGFDKVFMTEKGDLSAAADKLHALNPEANIVRIISSGSVSEDPASDINITPSDIARMWKRACVSNYTAASVWEKMCPEIFD